MEVFKTAGRTGILIFLSLFERRVVILADSGIHAAVPPSAWDEIAGRLAASLKRGERGAALVRAIQECGALLERPPLSRAADDANELPDTLQRRPE
jgi:putative membrane protein